MRREQIFYLPHQTQAVFTSASGYVGDVCVCVNGLYPLSVLNKCLFCLVQGFHHHGQGTLCLCTCAWVYERHIFHNGTLKWLGHAESKQEYYEVKYLLSDTNFNWLLNINRLLFLNLYRQTSSKCPPRIDHYIFKRIVHPEMKIKCNSSSGHPRCRWFYFFLRFGEM